MPLASVPDNRGNITEVERYFGKTASDDPEPHQRAVYEPYTGKVYASDSCPSDS